MATVYKIINEITGQAYVGHSVDVRQRINRHFSELAKNGHHCLPLQEDYNKYGRVMFHVVYVKDNISEEEATTLEQKLIDEGYDNLYNVGKFAKHGGDLMSYNPRKEEIRKKISNSVRAVYANMTQEERSAKYGSSGADNPMYGKTHSPEARAKMREANLGRAPSNKGKTNLEYFGEEKAKEISMKISASAKKRTGEHNPFYGKTHSDETKEKIRLANTGKRNVNCHKPVVINKLVYESVTYAAEVLGVTAGTILHRIKSDNPLYKGYAYFIE